MPPSVAVVRSVRVGGDTKTKRSRRVLALLRLAVVELREHRARQAVVRQEVGEGWRDHGLVFCRDDGAPLDAMRVLRGLRLLTRKAGLGNEWRARELRHSFVLILNSEGVRIERIADLVGHSAPTTTAVYRKRIRPMITHGAEMMDTLFREDDPV